MFYFQLQDHLGNDLMLVSELLVSQYGRYWVPFVLGVHFRFHISCSRSSFLERIQ